MNKLFDKLAELKFKLLKKLLQLKDFIYFLGCGLLYFITAVIGTIKAKRVKEVTALFTVVVLFFLSNVVLRWLDPTAATYDAGVLQNINLVLVKYAAFLFVAWSSFQTIWPDLGDFMKHQFKETFNALSPWEKIRLSVFVYCFHLSVLVMLSLAVQ